MLLFGWFEPTVFFLKTERVINSNYTRDAWIDLLREVMSPDSIKICLPRM
jgi:hypothetical protein